MWNCVIATAFPSSFLAVLPPGRDVIKYPNVTLRPVHTVLFVRLRQQGLHVPNRRNTNDQTWPGPCSHTQHRRGAAEISPKLTRGRENKRKQSRCNWAPLWYFLAASEHDHSLPEETRPVPTPLPILLTHHETPVSVCLNERKI